MHTKEISLRILGCGSSGGVPRIGGPDGAGEWGACDPADPRNRRTRCSVLVRRGETTVLVDTSPDMREQLLAARIGRLDAVLMTHEHADQTAGIDDLRVVAYNARRRVDVHADRATLAILKRRYGYCFSQPPGSAYPPILTGHEIVEPFREFQIAGQGGPLPVRAFRQEHGGTPSLGFRFGPIAYSPDVNGLDEAAFAALQGVSVWIVDALRHRPHPTHANVATALEWIERVRPRRAILTNLHVDLDYTALARELPPGVEPAYDGLTVTEPLG